MIAQALQSSLRDAPKTWLITGVAGFIGSNLIETPFKFDRHVQDSYNFALRQHRKVDDIIGKQLSPYAVTKYVKRQ